MSRLPAAVLTASIVLTVAASGQSGVDFSGTWKMDPARSESTRQGEPIAVPYTVVITQSGSDLRVETQRGERTESIRYKVGAAHAPASGADTRLQPEAYWDGDKLVTETQRQVQGYAVTVKEVRSLTRGGAEMIMETTVIVQHGYTMSGVQNYGMARDVFTRVNP